MTRARDNRRRNRRETFALYRSGFGSAPVSSFWLTESDGCSEQFVRDAAGVGVRAELSDLHDPDAHVLGVFGEPDPLFFRRPPGRAPVSRGAL